MKRILAYGDSNTWGQMAYDGRYHEDEQWCNILAHIDSNRRVVQEGLCARIAGDYETEKPVRNGRSPFEAIFRSALPLDVVIISLGTNDLKVGYERSASDIVDDLLWYKNKIDSIQDTSKVNSLQIVYLAPANFVDNKKYFDAHEKTRQDVIQLLKEKTDNVVVVNNLPMSKDGVHYSKEAHVEIAKIIDKKLKEFEL